MGLFNLGKNKKLLSLQNTINKYLVDNTLLKNKNNNYTIDILINELAFKFSDDNIDTPIRLEMMKYPNSTAYFKNGILYKVSPSPSNNLYEDRDVAYQSRYIVSDGNIYDLFSLNDIAKLPLPKQFTSFSSTSIGVVGSLDYILKMITSNYIKMGMKRGGALLTLKTYKFMMESPTLWQEKDFKRLLINLFECGQFDIADKLEMELHKESKNPNQPKPLEIYDSFNTGYYEASYFLSCCSECAKYRGRWYSNIDKKYPNLPKPYKCTCSGLTFHSVILGVWTPYINEFIDEKIDIENFSNRPFIDDRTDEEKENYEKFNLEQQNKNARDNIYFSDKKDYHILEYYFPEQKPKSFRSFMYKKKNNPDEYQQLMDLVEKYKRNNKKEL